MKIRLAEIKDVSSLDSVRIKSIKGLCAEVYNKDQVKAMASKLVDNDVYEKSIERKKLFVVGDATTIEGFIQFRLPLKTSSAANIDAIYITPEAAKQGFGAKLIEKVESLSKEQGVTQIKVVVTKNAEPFFVKLGYEIAGPAMRQSILDQVINMQPLFKTLILPPKIDKSDLAND